jgi:hypothetical protein
MSTLYARQSAGVAERDARQRHAQACARTLEAFGWQQHLALLAETFVHLRLVRGANEHGAPVGRLDAHVLRDCQFWAIIGACLLVLALLSAA